MKSSATETKTQFRSDLEDLQQRIIEGLVDQAKQLSEEERRHLLAKTDAYIRGARIEIQKPGQEEKTTLDLREYLLRVQSAMYRRYPESHPNFDPKSPMVQDYIVNGSLISITSGVRAKLKPRFSFLSKGNGPNYIKPGAVFHTNETGPETTRRTTLLHDLPWF